jgi:hypothetical protein
MEPSKRQYEVEWATGDKDTVLAVNRMEARQTATLIWAGSRRATTAVTSVTPLNPTKAERRAAR